MSTQVTLTLPDEVYRRAARLAQVSHRDLAEVIADTLAAALPSLHPRPDTPAPVAALSDAEVLERCELQLPPARDRRLTQLLDLQQVGSIGDAERGQLAALLQVYQEQLLYKAQALEEAVRRGLLPPLLS